MSEDPRRPPRDSMPPVVWALLGMLVIALFVLAIGVLHGPG